MNGFFKLVEALPQIYSCFVSHSTKLYVAYRYQQLLPRCITFHVVCVKQLHVGLPFSGFK